MIEYVVHRCVAKEQDTISEAAGVNLCGSMIRAGGSYFLSSLRLNAYPGKQAELTLLACFHITSRLLGKILGYYMC
jgi:hypothetical protein